MLKRIGALLGLISIATSPWTTYDPINPLKFLLLGICGSICLVFLIINRKRIQLNKVVLLASLLFILQALISTLFSESNFSQDVYGHYGRYFGLFTWVMLFSIMNYLSLFQEFSFLLRVFLITGSVSFTYSIIQYYGNDPAPWQNNFSPILGFLGNPNFQSSFLGLFLVALCGLLLLKLKSPMQAVFIFLVIIVTALLILSSGSIQGLFVAATGVASFGMYFLYAKGLVKTFWSLSTSGLITLVFFVLSVIGVGPLEPFIHRGTLAIRGDYWLAALSMAKDNILTGVGPDQFGTWYRFYRHENAITRINASVVTDSAHNGYLDFAANLGITALIAYFILIIYAVIAMGKYIRRHDSLDLSHATLAALFFGFQAQFLISPNQIGLVIWGWVFLGAIFGFANDGDTTNKVTPKPKKNLSKPVKTEDHFSLIGVSLLGTLIGLLIIGPIFYSSMQFRSALVKADAIKIISAANVWPRNENLLRYSANLLFTNNLQQQGITIVKSGLSEFPNSFDLWNAKLSYKWISEIEKSEALEQLRRLDPLNPEWASKE
jgi:O-antigen ligase